MKPKTIFTCQNCSAQAPKWMGKCPECQQWNTLIEETYTETTVSQESAKGYTAFRASLLKEGSNTNKPLTLLEIKPSSHSRIKTKLTELDQVLGGGLVAGSLVLIGGDPGIGKSTLIMQGLNAPLLYVSGEESSEQIKLRAQRLGITDPQFYVLSENCFEAVFEWIQKLKPATLIIDSIQTLYSSLIQSAPGSVSQVKECTAKLMNLAKSWNITTFIIGHVTKDGSIAGPKMLEHMVDTVLYFEGSTHSQYRILRAVKNRFGSINEIGVFEMQSMGLKEIKNPSELFLQDKPNQPPGTAIVSTLEGSRPLLVEVQALVSSSQFPIPKRTSFGMDANKLSLLVAVIEKRLGLAMYGHDLFFNVVGGLKLEDPAVELGVALAFISSFQNTPLPARTLYCGEVGLTGEIRHIPYLEERLKEAAKLGFKKALIPASNFTPQLQSAVPLLEIFKVQSLSEAVELVLK